MPHIDSKTADEIGEIRGTFNCLLIVRDPDDKARVHNELKRVIGNATQCNGVPIKDQLVINTSMLSLLCLLLNGYIINKDELK